MSQPDGGPTPSMDAGGLSRELRLILWLCIAIGVIRLVSLSLYPVLDRTESRYAEIARTMAGLWLCPTCGILAR